MRAFLGPKPSQSAPTPVTIPTRAATHLLSSPSLEAVREMPPASARSMGEGAGEAARPAIQPKGD